MGDSLFRSAFHTRPCAFPQDTSLSLSGLPCSRTIPGVLVRIAVQMRAYGIFFSDAMEVLPGDPARKNTGRTTLRHAAIQCRPGLAQAHFATGRAPSIKSGNFYNRFADKSPWHHATNQQKQCCKTECPCLVPPLFRRT